MKAKLKALKLAARLELNQRVQHLERQLMYQQQEMTVLRTTYQQDLQLAKMELERQTESQVRWLQDEINRLHLKLDQMRPKEPETVPMPE